MMKTRTLLLAAGLASALSAVAIAGGLFPDFPVNGGASYCASTNQAGVPGTSPVCTTTVPAGPTTATGAETFLANTNLASGQAPQNVVFKASAFSIGAKIDLTTVATAQTIPAQTPWYFLDGAQGSALTVTMPAAPLDHHIQHIVCTAATVGVLTVSANTGQTLKNNPNAACTAGVGYAWVYDGPTSTWFRFQ